MKRAYQSPVSLTKVNKYKPLVNVAKKAIKKVGLALVRDQIKKNIKKKQQQRKTAKKRGRGRGRVSRTFTGHLGGKVAATGTYSRAQTINGKYTQVGIEKNGVTVAYELRRVIAVPDTEAVAVGHTSMPSKHVAAQFWRALTKYLFLKMGIEIIDYSQEAITLGFVAGDIIRLAYYSTPQPVTYNLVDITISAGKSLDEIANDFTVFWDDILNLSTHRMGRWIFLPQPTSRFQGFDFDISNLKMSTFCKTHLKVQNVTAETDQDNEADDITAVPLQGMIYKCKGNNFVRRNNGRMLSGLFNGQDEIALYGTWTKNDSAATGGVGLPFYSVASQSTISKPAEVPKPWEIKNCINNSKIYVPPGAIRTSSFSTLSEMSLNSLFQLIYGTQLTQSTNAIYSENLGHTNVMYLEKTVGRASTNQNRIKLWTELEFRMGMLAHGGTPRYTAPITTQINYTDLN